MVGLLDWLGITDPSTSQSAPPPPSGGQGLLGSTQPQIPTWDQYNQQRQSFSGLLAGILGHGIGPGIAGAMAPDSEAMANYNALLGQGQGVEMGRLGLPKAAFTQSIYSNLGGNGGQQAAPAATPMPTQSGLGFGGAPAAFNDMDPSGITQMLPSGLTGQITHRDPTAFNDMDPTGIPGVSPPQSRAPQGAPQGGNTLFGIPLPPGMDMRQLLAAEAVAPGTAKDILGKAFPGPVNVRPGGAVFNPITGQVMYQQPQLPQGQIYRPGANGQPGVAATIPGSNYQHAILQGIDQGARATAEKNVKGFENTLEFGGLGVGGGGGGQGAGGPGPLRTSGGPLSAPALPSGKPIVTEQGTTIPPATEQAPINRAGAYLKEALPEWSKTETAWSNALPALNAADMQMNAIADALKRTQAGSFATDKADIAAKLKAVGIELPASVWGDPAQVQIALKNNAISALNTLKGTTTRFTQMEFDRISKALANPDLQPEAALSILSESLGQIHSGQAQANDWATAKRNGWENPIDFQRAWTQANPTQKFVDQARTQIGPLMGMPGGPQSGGQAKITIGTTATGPNGARVKWDGMKWNPM